MILKTERLTLRPFALTDLETTHAYAGSAENALYMIFLPNENIAETREFLGRTVDQWQSDNQRTFEFAVVLGEHHIGAVSVYINDDLSEGELGWIIHRDHWGCGYATEAARAVMDFAISEFPMRRIIAQCDAVNAASAGVMRKLGMRLVSDDGVRQNRASIMPSREHTYALDII